MRKDKERDRRKKSKSKYHRVSHETPTGRRLLNRKYRRTQKRKAARDGEDGVTPTGKDYKTGGWVTR